MKSVHIRIPEVEKNNKLKIHWLARTKETAGDAAWHLIRSKPGLKNAEAFSVRATRNATNER